MRENIYNVSDTWNIWNENICKISDKKFIFKIFANLLQTRKKTANLTEECAKNMNRQLS